MANKKKCPGCQKFISPTASYCLYCGMQFADADVDNENDQNESIGIPIRIPTSTETNSQTFKMKPVNSPGLEGTYSSEKQNVPSEGSKLIDKDHLEESAPYEDQEEDLSSAAASTTDTDDDEFLQMLNHNPSESDNSSVYEDDPDEEDEIKSFMEEDDEYAEDDFSEEDIETEDEMDIRKNPGKSSLKEKLMDRSQQAFSMLKQTGNKPNPTAAKKAALQKPKIPASKNISESEENTYDPNYDEYYNNLIGLVDAERKHITVENVVKTISIIALFIIVVLLCLFFI